MLSPKNTEEIINTIIKYCDPGKIVIFGSYAKGCNTQKSDIDVLVLMNSAQPKEVRGRELRNFFSNSITPIDFQFYTPEEFEEEKCVNYSFANSIDKTGIVVYEKK